MLAIDSHHHIWDPSVGDFSWMTAAHKLIDREFTLDDLKPLLLEARISHTILVQTWSSLEEFTEAATASGLIYNGDFIPVNVPALYDAYTSNPTEFKQTAEYKFLTQ